MKKLLLLITISLSALTCYSQTEKGKKMIGGQLRFSGYNSSNVDSSTISKVNIASFSINPRVGYFIKDNFAVGIIGNFTISGSNRNDVYSKSKGISIGFGIGGFGRYYKKINDKFLFFVNGDILYSHSPYTRYENTSNTVTRVITTETFYHTISIAVSPGLVYFPSSKLGIEASFGNLFYNYEHYKKSLSYANYVNTNSYGFNLSSASFLLGMNYYF
jgi:hypothetical protein